MKWITSVARTLLEFTARDHKFTMSSKRYFTAHYELNGTGHK